MEEKVSKIIDLVQASALDQTIKDIIIRDLQTDGLNDFLRDQIVAYCVEGIAKSSARIEEAKKILAEHEDANSQA